MTRLEALEDVERKRQTLQAAFDQSAAARDRNLAGQFATPPAVARQVVEAVAPFVGDGPRRLLEPACGTGAFYSAWVQYGRPGKDLAGVGVEKNPGLARLAKQLWAPHGLEVCEGDFLRWRRTQRRHFDLILANPPYVRHHHIPIALKRELKDRVRSELELDPSGLCGLYVHFLLLTHRVLAPGAISAWLIPSEFLDTRYGEVLRRYLCRRVSLLRIHRFDPSDPLFEDAQVTSTVVVFRNRPPDDAHRAAFSQGGTLGAPFEEEAVTVSQLDPAQKWGQQRPQASADHAEGPALRDFFDVRRGIATGANAFFIRPRSELANQGVEAAHQTPVLPSPRKLASNVIRAESDGWPALTPQLSLLNCALDGPALHARDPALADYMAQGKAAGLNERYLLRRRKPWYSQERRAPAPFLCTYMGRERGGSAAFRFIHNRSRAIATNVYLMLYPKGPLKTSLSLDPALGEAVHEALLALGTEDLRRGGRVYGGGLQKMEPRELGALRAGELRALARPS